jgi:hypothetical protein
MAHYKNVVRDHNDFDLEIKGKKIFILDEREKFDRFPDNRATQTINGTRIVVVDSEGNVTDYKLRDKDFWATVSSEMAPKKSCSKKVCNEKKTSDKKITDKKRPRMPREKFVGRSEDGIS